MDDRFEIDRSKWKKPTYLGHYDERATFYEGIRTSCRKCGKFFVFSEEAQKVAFEVESRYSGWLPTLCSVCSSEWDVLEEKILEYETSWDSNRLSLGTDQEFLSSWLASLKDAQLYGKKCFDSRIRMLLKALVRPT